MGEGREEAQPRNFNNKNSNKQRLHEHICWNIKSRKRCDQLSHTFSENVWKFMAKLVSSAIPEIKPEKQKNRT